MVSFLSLGVKEKTFILVTILERVIHQTAQPSNKHMDESASRFLKRAVSLKYLSVCLPMVFIQTCRPFKPSNDSVYTKLERGNRE